MRFFALFALIALAEMATFFWVESQIGLAWALAIALSTALVGSLLVRRAGVAVLGRIRQKVNQAQLPGRELTHGASILVAGAFLISPGFITDTLGFLLLVPPVRDLIHRQVSKRFSDRFSEVKAGASPWRAQRDDVIDVEVVDERPGDEGTLGTPGTTP